jgi:DNA polymerase-4
MFSSMPDAPARPLRWLYLDLNSFFASVEQQLDPALRGRPVAVGPAAIDSGTIIAASYEAKAFGIRTGMKVGEAKRRCPGLRFASGSHRRYVEFHEAVVAEVWRHIPVTRVCSIDEVACRLLDNENSAANARELGHRIKAGIRRHVGDCLTASVGIAPSRLLAKIAADMQKPDGLTLLEARDLPHALLPLPLRDVPGIGPRMEARLLARGIRSMAELLAQNPGDAGGAWGSVVGTRLWHALHGADLPDRPRQSRSIGHSHVLAPDRRSPETARLTARRLLAKAGYRLRRAGCVTRHVTLHARLESRRSWSATRRTPATDDSFRLLEALAELWPVLETALAGTRIRTIGVSLDDIMASPESGGPATQPGLFDGPSATAALARAMDRVWLRFGPDALSLGPPPAGRAARMGARIAFGHIPEAADFAPPGAQGTTSRSAMNR